MHARTKNALAYECVFYHPIIYLPQHIKITRSDFLLPARKNPPIFTEIAGNPTILLVSFSLSLIK